MKFGLYFDVRKSAADLSWSQHYARTLELCERAEEAGIASLWITEHHRFADGYMPQPLVFAAAIAARTTRARIGTAIVIAPLRNTVHLAEEAAVVDILSEGRLDLGLGSGYLMYEFDMFGASPGRPTTRMFEQIDELRQIYVEKLISPLPIQAPLPIWVGSQGVVGARRAGRIGAPLLSIRREQVDPYLMGLREGGFDPSKARMSGHVNIFLTDDPQRDRDDVVRSYSYLWDTYAAAASSGHGRTVNAPTDMAQALRLGLSGGTNGLTIATPEEAAVLLREFLVDVPAESIYTWADPPRMSAKLRDRHIELWASVMPELVGDL